MIENIFEKIGFVRVRYPEVEWDFFAFGALNFPKNHPARDDWETFFVDAKENPKLGAMLLTPHTSSGQIREMTGSKPPIKMLNIAKCYRRQNDVSHTPMFHQFEGLALDKNLSIVNLKGVLDFFVKSYFGPERVSRITRGRPLHRECNRNLRVQFSRSPCRNQYRPRAGTHFRSAIARRRQRRPASTMGNCLTTRSETQCTNP